MCGIAGFAFTDPRHPVDRKLLGRITGVLRHRGPDADGSHLGPGVGLAHRRLSIIDLATGDQPIYLHTFEDFGLECVKRLRGMFTFALWDESHRRLALARDRAGGKTLHYHGDAKHPVLASEIKALLQDPSIKRRISPEGLSDYFTLGVIPVPGTVKRSDRQPQDRSAPQTDWIVRVKS